MNLSLRPKMKNTIPYFLLEGEVKIGEEAGMACFIEDPTGSVAMLVTCMDGTKSLTEIISAVQSGFPDIEDGDIINAVRQLDELGFLEDADKQPHELTPYFQERYKANLNYFSLFTNLEGNKHVHQEKINKAKIALLGIGGLGSQILYHLSAVGFHNVKALDFDRLELSNFNRQLLYSEADLGELKTELAKKRIAQFNPHVDLQITTRRIESAQDVIEHITGADLVICVADKPTMHIRHWVNEAVVKTGIPLISGGVVNTRGRFFTMIPGQSGCIQCGIEQYNRANTKHREQLGYMNETSYTRQNATISPNVGMLAGIMANEAVKMITGIATPFTISKAHEINFVTYQISEVAAWDKVDDCPVCGVHAHSFT